MKGIILAAGKGTRLGPVTLGIGVAGKGIAKPLVPVYDKPTIYYPLANLISAGISDILIICAPDSITQFESCLGNGSELGISLHYSIQEEPKGTADALIIGEDFIGNDDIALIFGDNLIHSSQFAKALAAADPKGATVFAYPVTNPEDFGVVEFDHQYRVLSIEEKPSRPKSNYAAIGAYYYPNEAIGFAKQLEPSERGEYEITDINNRYLSSNLLSVVPLDSGAQWFDTGNPEELSRASEYTRTTQKQSASLIGSPELAAFRAGFITSAQLTTLAKPLAKSVYGKILEEQASEGAI